MLISLRQKEVAMRYAIDILKKKPRTFNYIEPDAKVSDALSLLSSMNRSFLVVMKGNQFNGIFSEREFIRNLTLGGKDTNCRVETVMNSSLPVVSADTPVEEVIMLFHIHHVNYLPVFEEGRFEGIITLHNIMKMLCEEKGYVFEN